MLQTPFVASRASHGPPSDHGASRGTPGIKSGSWKEHRARQRFSELHDGTPIFQNPRSAHSGLHHAKGHRIATDATFE